MRFILQNDEKCMDTEIYDLKKILMQEENKLLHKFVEISITEIKSFDWDLSIDIPVGTLDFIRTFLEVNNKSSLMKPLEVPECLQAQEFLCRRYEVKNFNDLPKTGSYFVKDVSVLKSWEPQEFFMSTFADAIRCISDDYDKHEYAISSVLDIDSEFRVLVCNDIVEGCMNYSGNCLSFPSKDKILKMINILKYNREFKKVHLPRSYTLDIAVLKSGETCILELHNFVSCGTYGFTGNALPWMYRDGIVFEVY